MLNSTAKRLWGDESGFIVSADLILISTILVIGLLVGLVSLRDQIVQELGDVAVAVGNLNQSYSFSGYTVTIATPSGDVVFSVAGSNFADESDFCEVGNDEVNTSVGIDVTVEASPE